ncbi:MAG TPA: TonB-dependent receptor [Pyrinomonadaceae bacterium]|nr:TonB-dependent receptor [Pyrinomonadaceae bacterium]
MKIQAIKKITRAVSLLLIAFIISITVIAQSNTGSITGVVADPNGAVVPNATVNVTNQGTNEKRTVQTDSEGRYEVPSLPTGVYTVEASGSGFAATSVKDLRLAVGERARADIALSAAGVSAVVEVIDQTRTDTETSTIGDTVGTARISDNPVNGRDFTQLLATIPGSVQTSNVFQTTINGIPSSFGGASVLVDGVDASRVDLNGTSNVLGRVESRVNRVSMDSIQEIQVVEQNYSAQYGQALGAVINPITKSGTNNLHGSVFEYFRNEGLDSEDAVAGKQRFRLNQFGGNISGPIKKDKWFFFTNYEGVRQSRGIAFTDVLVPLQSFRNAMVPSIRPVVATLPLPQRPHFLPNGTLDPDNGEFSGQRIGDLREDTGSVKIDWLQSEKSQFSVRYNINDSDTDVPYGVGTDQIANAKLRTQLLKVSHNYVLGSTTTNEFGFGINHNFTDVGAGSSTLPRFNMIFIDFAINSPGPAQFDQKRTGVVYQFFDTLSMIRDHHSLKFGVDVRLNRRSALSRTQDTLTFFSMADFKNNAPFVIQRNGNPELNYANENFSFFANDDWRFNPRLSLNLGLRYEVSTVSREKDGLLQNFDLATLTYTPVGQKIHNVDKNNFGPRVGFAFDIFGDSKTVLRGGYGIFYNRELPASYGNPAANSFPQVVTDLFDLFDPVHCPNPPSTFAYPVDPAVFACGQASALAIERNLKTAMAQHWSLNLQRDLGVGTLQVGYVGNHVTHLLTDGVISPRNINRADPLTGVRPLSAAFGDIFVVGGYPQSNYNAMQVNFKRNLTKGFRFNANYTWSHAMDDVVGFFKDYQDENNARAERASSDQDVRHNFSFDAGYDLPLRSWFKGGPGWLVNGWQLNTIIQARSGLPVTVTSTGGIFSGFSFRPNVVSGVNPYCEPYSVPNCQFNAAAFTAIPGTFGNAGRNILRGPRFTQVDASFFKNTKLSERTSLQLRLEIFNLFDFANYADPSGGLTCAGSVGGCSTFGKSISTVGNQLGGLLGFGGPRQIQLSARFNF